MCILLNTYIISWAASSNLMDSIIKSSELIAEYKYYIAHSKLIMPAERLTSIVDWASTFNHGSRVNYPSNIPK